jgi:hypothetical protein
VQKAIELSQFRMRAQRKRGVKKDATEPPGVAQADSKRAQQALARGYTEQSL